MNASTERGAQPNVSILILHYKGPGILRDCLHSLRPLVAPDVEVVLVDNGSEEDIAQEAAGFDFVRCFKTGRNLGFAGGNNFGLQYCRGKYVLLLNDDTVVNPEFVSALTAYLEQHRDVGIVQGKMLLPRFGGILDVCGSFLTRVGLPYNYGCFKPDGLNYQRSYPVFCGKGACLMFRREIVDRIGGFLFDEDFFCYYEETDFCHRAWLAGYETHFVPSPPIQHFMGATSQRNPQQGFALRRYVRNMTFSLLANLSFASRLRIMPPFFTIIFANMVVSALALKRHQALAYAGALILPLKECRAIRARRKLIRSIRRRSDREMFAKVMKTPHLDYFIKTFQGRLGEYEDQPLD